MSDVVNDYCSPYALKMLSGSVLMPIANAYAQHLVDQGYANSAIGSYVRSLAHFAYWLKCRSIELKGINENLVKHFVIKHLLKCQCAQRCQRNKSNVRAALAHLLKLLRLNGLLAPKTINLPARVANELRGFDTWLSEVRGLRAVTRQARVKHVSTFLMARYAIGDVEIGEMKPAEVIQFIQKATLGWKPASVNIFTSSLRSYLHFKMACGTPATALIAALPRIAQWKLANLPKTLSVEEIQRLLKVFDRKTGANRRDRAIVRCYVDLGLRTSEIARLQLDDIDWHDGVVQIRGKGRRIDILPLPVTTGRAIVEYLQKERPQTASRALFLRHRPPQDKPASPETIRASIRNAARRCGLGERLTGPHLLRHTIAKRLVESGATLKEIADFLRHRSLNTTAIYAKVDLDALRKIAAPWLGGES